MENVTFREHQLVVAGYSQQIALLNQRSADNRASLEQLEKHLVEVNKAVEARDKQWQECLDHAQSLSEAYQSKLAATGLVAMGELSPDSDTARDAWSPSMDAVLKLRQDLAAANCTIAALKTRKRK